jgi:hypothetical protein
MKNTKNKTPNKILWWAPRVLIVLMAIFVSIFAIHAVDDNYEFPFLILATMMHAVPTALVLMAGAIAWRKEESGGPLFIFLGLLYIILGWGSKPLIGFITISGPLFLIGTLFLLNEKLKE